MARMSPDEARREFDRLRERFERELTGRMDNPSGPAGCLPLHGDGEETGEAQTSADVGEGRKGDLIRHGFAVPPSPPGEGFWNQQGFRRG